MAKNRSASSARGKPAVKNARHMPDSGIDFSDIPESTDEELGRATRVGRPKAKCAKQLIAIRLDPRLLFKLRQMASRRGKPYQTFIHELLQRATTRAA